MANRKQAKKMASTGATAKDIRRETGVKASNARIMVRNATQEALRASAAAERAAAATPAPTPPSSTPTRELKGTLGEALKTWGGGPGINKEELRTILSETDQPGKLIQKLDDINTKLSKKDKAGIGLTSGARNMLIRKGTNYKQKGGPVSPWDMMIDGGKKNKYDFGTGFIGSDLTERLGSAGTMAVPAQRNKVYNSGFTPGSGRAATDPTPGRLVAQGMDIGPKGRERVRGFGQQYEVPERFLGDGGEKTKIISKEENPPTTESWTSGPTEGDTEPVAPTETVDNSLSSGTGGLDIASWATGFRAARSARKKAGKGSQGLGSMKKAPFTSWLK